MTRIFATALLLAILWFSSAVLREAYAAEDPRGTVFTPIIEQLPKPVVDFIESTQGINRAVSETSGNISERIRAFDIKETYQTSDTHAQRITGLSIQQIIKAVLGIFAWLFNMFGDIFTKLGVFASWLFSRF